MGNLRQEAEQYEPPTTKNIADLEEVPVDLDISEKTATNDKEEQFKYKFFEIEGEEYRVPATVLKQLKEILAEKPDLEKFKVKKTGQGLNTSYTVIPL